MKKRATFIFLGIIMSCGLLSACKSDKAKEAANESAQIEEEGLGERTEEGEKVEEETTADQTSSDEETDEIQEKESAGTIGVLLPQEDENYQTDSQTLKEQIEEAGYDAEIQNAQGDSEMQISQIRTLVESGVSALIVNPVDPYSLTDVLESTSEKSIPVISYDKLIRDTADINYYAAFDMRAIGNQIAGQIVKDKDLDKAREEHQSYTIEFLMGSPDNEHDLFLCNGIFEKLQEYIDDGTLVCKSGKTSFDDTGIMRGSNEAARNNMDSVLTDFYSDEKTSDIICTASDSFSDEVIKLLEDRGLEPGSEEWPMITGFGSEVQAVKNVAEGKLSFTVYTDRKKLAEDAVKMAIDKLNGDKVDVRDYSQYDNGVKIVGTCTEEGELIDKDNYQILVDNGTYTEDEIAPAPTATPTPKITVSAKPGKNM